MSVRAGAQGRPGEVIPLGDVAHGDIVDGGQVILTERVLYSGNTYDILPSGGTGHYWADRILAGSTLFDAQGCGE